MILIDKTTYKAGSFNDRIRFLILHYTEVTLEKSLELLLGGEVSSHYLVSDTNPNHIFQLVDESKRAWHAGPSSWQGRTNLNDTSIGIEIVNLGYKKTIDGKIIWYDYEAKQIDSVIELCQNIIASYNIHPTCVVGHSDIALGRKVDPGPLFPWKQLYDNNIGAWYDETAIKTLTAKLELDNIRQIQEKFARYGYPIELTDIIDEQTTNVIKSFQMHFRSQNFSGVLDIETVAILESLLQKYFP
jgi:N-acetylmuramoyl-L-alanine amidase